MRFPTVNEIEQKRVEIREKRTAKDLKEKAQRERVTALLYEKCKATAIKQINIQPMQNEWAVYTGFNGYSKEGSPSELDVEVLMCRITKDLQGTGIRASFKDAKPYPMGDGGWSVCIEYTIEGQSND